MTSWHSSAARRTRAPAAAATATPSPAPDLNRISRHHARVTDPTDPQGQGERASNRCSARLPLSGGTPVVLRPHGGCSASGQALSPTSDSAESSASAGMHKHAEKCIDLYVSGARVTSLHSSYVSGARVTSLHTSAQQLSALPVAEYERIQVDRPRRSSHAECPYPSSWHCSGTTSCTSVRRCPCGCRFGKR